MAIKKREGRRIPTYVIEESESYPKVSRNNYNEFIKLKKMDFELTNKQKDLIKMLHSNKIITVTGPPGTSKTFVACYAGIQMLLDGRVDNIILSKPTEILSGTKDLGSLPGDLETKIGVYAESFMDSFDEFLTQKDLKHLLVDKKVEFKPAQFLRGRTLKKSFIIIDEYQNFDISSLKSIVTRLGRGSTICFLGDSKQNDINKRYVAVEAFNSIMDGIRGYSNFTFLREDIVREQILIDIIDKFEEYENKLPETIRGN